jgi:hypothetical protein
MHLIFKVCLWNLIFHIFKFKNMCQRNKDMLMPNACLYYIFALNLNSCCCRWIYSEAWKKCLQYACFYLCNFIHFDSVGHWPNSTQHVHLCMCVVGWVCIYLCLCDVKTKCFCLDVLWTLDCIIEVHVVFIFLLGGSNQDYIHDKVDNFEIMDVLTRRDSSQGNKS